MIQFISGVRLKWHPYISRLYIHCLRWHRALHSFLCHHVIVTMFLTFLAFSKLFICIYYFTVLDMDTFQYSFFFFSFQVTVWSKSCKLFTTLSWYLTELSAYFLHNTCLMCMKERKHCPISFVLSQLLTCILFKQRKKIKLKPILYRAKYLYSFHTYWSITEYLFQRVKYRKVA